MRQSAWLVQMGKVSCETGAEVQKDNPLGREVGYSYKWIERTTR